MDWFYAGNINLVYLSPYILGCIASLIWARISTKKNKNDPLSHDPGFLYHLLLSPLSGIFFSFPIYIILIALNLW